MAGDAVQVDSSGAVQIKNNSVSVGGSSDPCCCPMWIQAKFCSDNSNADLWFVCHGTPFGGITIDCAAGTGTHIPYYFSLSGTNYYVAPDNVISSTHGTLCTGETQISGCPAIPFCGCFLCSNNHTPEAISVNLSALALCTGCTESLFNITGGSLGTYTLTRNEAAAEYGGSFPCSWFHKIPYASNPLTIVSCRPGEGSLPLCLDIYIDLSRGGSGAFTLTVSTWFAGIPLNFGPQDDGSWACSDIAVYLFEGRSAAVACIEDGPFSITNTVACGGCLIRPFQPVNEPFGTLENIVLCNGSHGGSATLTPGSATTCECTGVDCAYHGPLCAVVSGTSGGSGDGSYDFADISGGSGECAFFASGGFTLDCQDGHLELSIFPRVWTKPGTDPRGGGWTLVTGSDGDVTISEGAC